MEKLEENRCDIIYIDDSHKTKDVLYDLVLCWDLLKKDGILIVDDYLWKADERPINLTPKVAVDSFITIYSDELKLLHKESQVLDKTNKIDTYINEFYEILDWSEDLRSLCLKFRAKGKIDDPKIVTEIINSVKKKEISILSKAMKII